MSEFLSDKEQEERLKKALKNYGSWIMLGVAAALLAFSGFRYYQNKQIENQVNAAMQLEQVMISGEDAVASLNETDEQTQTDAAKNTVFLASVDQLVEAYPDTTQAYQALLMKAKYLAESDQLDKAAAALSSAAEVGPDEGLQALAKLRLATIQIQQEQPDQALQTLEGVQTSGFQISRDSLMGDAYVAKDQPDEAVAAYQSAWEGARDRGDDRPELRYKLESLGVNPAQIEQPTLINNL